MATYSTGTPMRRRQWHCFTLMILCYIIVLGSIVALTNISYSFMREPSSPVADHTSMARSELHSTTNSSMPSPSQGTPSANSNPSHDRPDYFSKHIPLEAMFARKNVIMPHTGCSIATWTYKGEPWEMTWLNDCADDEPVLITELLQPYDSIYVTFAQIHHFIKHALPFIKVKVVLISGQRHLLPYIGMSPENETFEAVIQHPYVTHWFIQNLGKYGLDPYRYHPKIIPFPYGVNPLGSPAFESFVSQTIDVSMKNVFVYAGYLDLKTNMEQRSSIPSGELVPFLTYLDHLRLSKYVLAPDGDRPECFRHFEAIALGAMPITQLDSHFYRHLEGNVIFNNTNWNLTQLESLLPANPEVNRRLIFIEYWMEYVERVVGHPLNWRDPTSKAYCSLAEITESVQNGASV